MHEVYIIHRSLKSKFCHPKGPGQTQYKIGNSRSPPPRFYIQQVKVMTLNLYMCTFSFSNCFNPWTCLTSGFVHPSHLDESYCMFRGPWWMFSFFLYILHRNSCKQTVLTMFRHRVLQRLNCDCTVCRIPYNGYPVQKGLKKRKKMNLKTA